MNLPSATTEWLDRNQRGLVAELSRIRALLDAHQSTRGAEPNANLGTEPPRVDRDAIAIDMVASRFQLSPFERDLLLLCAGVELDSSVAALCAAAHGDKTRAFPTFSLALSALPGAHWSALSPEGPLRAWRLITVVQGAALTSSQLRIDERVLHFLTGLDGLDERLSPLLERVALPRSLTDSHRDVAEQLIHLWMQAEREPPIIQLCGDRIEDKHAVASAACDALGLRLWALRAESLPVATSDAEDVRRLWHREALLGPNALLLDCTGLDGDESRASVARRFAEHTSSALVIATRERRSIGNRRVVALDVARTPSTEQEAAWREALGPLGEQLDGRLRQLSTQFNLSLTSIRAAAAQARSQQLGKPDSDLFGTLWEACRLQSRPRLDDLAQRIESSAAWADLVVPDAQLRILHDIAAHVRQRMRVYEEWGFARQGARGLGISALFAGASGTGKTMAAEVLANELRLDLHRVDLSAVVSKYIGETEKNLRRIFDAAEDGGAILLFDEADALFGKRSDVKDSHDRFANIEVSYLLQRMECYRGLAILTTNLKSALDTAFLRRIRFVVQFPFPDVEQRAEIWRRIFPREMPREALETERLAQLSVTGGNIRNIAMGAAFLAADADEPVRMTHLLRAARSEYAKMEKVLTEAEVTGWT